VDDCFTVCDDCVEQNEEAGESSQIVSVSDFDESFGDTCEFCEKTHGDELAL
jgi:hypothetical protein